MKVLGVHSVVADEPCHLLEVEFSRSSTFDWGDITQEAAGIPRENWQVPYDEQEVGNGRWVFYFHFLDLKKPLLVNGKPIALPEPTAMPVHLAEIEYLPP